MTAVRMHGVIDNMPEAEYHAHPSLSVSGAKKLLPPSCPALFKHDRDHGQKPRDIFDLGHAAHTLILGVGAPFAIVEADDWRGKAAREQRDEARANGHTPLLRCDYERVQGMAAALREHPTAAALLDRDKGRAEVSLFGLDKFTGTVLRARVDWLPDLTPDGRLILTDYKTTASAEPRAFGNAAAKFGYHMQAAFYMDLAVQLGLCDSDGIEFRLIAQEKTAPYLVTVAEFDDEAIRIGRMRNREAINIYAECMRTGVWLGYSDHVELLSLPMYMTSEYDLDVAS